MNQELREEQKSKFVIFDKKQDPKFGYEYGDPVVFYVINAAYILKDRQEDLKKILSEYIKLNDKTGRFEFNQEKNKEFFDKIMEDKPLSDLKIGALGKTAAMYLRFLEKLGARTRQINFGEEPLKSSNEQDFDITFSSNHFDSEEMKKYHTGNMKEFALRNYTLLSNITKINGFSIHSIGDYITTLYNLFFQLIGFKIVEYFRTQNSDKSFIIIMQKINSKTTNPEEFSHIFYELKHSNPIRYF